MKYTVEYTTKVEISKYIDTNPSQSSRRAVGPIHYE